MTSEEYERLIASIAKRFTNNPLEEKKWVVSQGRTNKILGFSGYRHQIDVSAQCPTDLLLIECKKWNRRISVSEYLTMLGRVNDIKSDNPKIKVRGAIVTTNGWQRGVEQLNTAYRQQISLFRADTFGSVTDQIHTAFISGKTQIRFTASGNLTVRKD